MRSGRLWIPNKQVTSLISKIQNPGAIELNTKIMYTCICMSPHVFERKQAKVERKGHRLAADTLPQLHRFSTAGLD